LRSLGTAGRQERRAELIKDVQQEVDYLYYAARRLQTQLDKVKKTIT
jgi:DNA anti-recombination protein RmuC